MQSGQVNASQLLGAFLGSVKAKLGQAMAKNDFSGELKKHLSEQADAGGTAELEEAGAVKTEEPAAKSTGSAAAVSSETKTAAPSVVQDKGLTDSSAKIKEIKSKAKTEKSLFLSNPAIIETILANLHYPANIRDQCAQLLNKHGRLSIQDLRSILGVVPDTVSGAGKGVPAAAVRTLIGSIVQVSGNAEGKAAAVEKSFKSIVAIKPNGSYTRDELRNLLEKVIEESQKTSSAAQSASSPSSSSSAVKTKTTESLKTEQAEELVSSVLPSFISSGRKVESENVVAGAVSKARGGRNADGKRADLRDNVPQAVSNGVSSQGGVSHGKNESSTGDGETIASGKGAMGHGGENGPSKTSVDGATPGQVVHTDTASGALGVAAELVDWIKALGSSTQSDAGASAGTTRTGSGKDVESRAELGSQDMPVLGKDIEKLTGGKDQPSENGAAKTAEAKLDDNPIAVPQMNNSGEGGFVFYDRNRMVQLAHDGHGGKTTGASDASPGDKNIAAIVASYISGEQESGSPAGILTGKQGNQKSDPQGAKKKDSGVNTVDASKNVKSAEQSGSDKADPVGGGINGPSNASASAGSVSQQEAVSVPVGVMDQGGQPGEGHSSGSSSGKDATQSVSATTAADKFTTVEQSAIVKQAAAKQGEEPSVNKDSSRAAAALQASASNFQTVTMHPADNSAQGGFAMYDPYRAVELVNNMREQAGIGAGSQLVLEMDSEGLGKINLKVGARKDEISVEALTQNEPARQLLMSHTVELRQDLMNQGLVLGKFMVDVNAGNPGGEGGSGSGANNPSGGKRSRGTSKATKTAPVQKSETPTRTAALRGLSQISIFA